MNWNIVDLTDEERESLIERAIALLVILFFGWLVYYNGWFAGKPEVTNVANNAVVVKNSDSDHDGIINKIDKCPLVYGSAESAGCPKATVAIKKKVVAPVVASAAIVPVIIDTDGDGFPDDKDACPVLVGTVNGCPVDTDADGVYDTDDSCPNTAGIITNAGCPADSDNDGIADANDRCVNLAGIAANAGCPADSDADGIYDVDDRCPAKAGNAENKGCPEVVVTEEEQKIITEAISSVNFHSGSAQLTAHSETVLDKVVGLLNNSSDYHLKIHGHTDSTGDEQLNLELSKLRAESVTNYLASKGIATTRMTHNGFGQTQPVAENSSKIGRAKNRRVEFKLHY